MIKISTLVLFFWGWSALVNNVTAQANPSAAILPLNAGGVVALGAVMDVQVTISNTLSGNIVASKLRPVITIPALATILPNVQQTGLPPGWVIVTNVSGQIRVCNASDVIGGFEQRNIIIKVQGAFIGGPTACQVQINFGGATCAVTGPQPTGNVNADDFAASSITVVPGCSLSVNATAGIINCNGGATSITAVPSSAPGPIEYSLTGAAPFQSSSVFNNVSSGTYTVTAREIANPTTCVAVSSLIIINSPAPIPAPEVNIIQPTCTISDGIVTITTAITGLTFSIDGGPFSAYPTGGYLLGAGSHTVTAENSNACISATTTFIVDAQPATPSIPVIGTITQPNCTLSTGSVELTNLPAGAWVIEPGSISGNTTSATLNNLAAGSYSFTVTNSLGCTSLPSGNVDIIVVVGAPDEPLVTISQPNCTEATGTVIITSPTTGFTFSLDGGAFVLYPAGGFTGIASGTHTLISQNISGCSSPVANITITAQPASPTAPTLSVAQPNCSVSTGTIFVTSDTTGLTFSLDGSPFAPYPLGGYAATTGIHSLAVQNLSGCIPNITNDIVVNAQPSTPSLSSVFTPITCFGGNSVITATASGGVLPYEFSINSGLFQNDNVFNVGAGSYTIAVKDSNGCIGNSSVILITQPSEITATVTASTIACNGGDATLTISASGGSGAYEYSVNNGMYQSGNTFSVVAGTYSANVRLINNLACSTAATTSVIVSQPGILKASVTAPAIRYCGGTTEVNVTATGGTPPYTGAGKFLKGPGYWTFIVTDSKGCSTSVDTYIFPPGCVELNVFPNPAQSYITVNHSASAGPSSYLQILSATGAKVLTHYVPYNTFISTINISNLSNGVYIIVYINGEEKKETRFIKITN